MSKYLFGFPNLWIFFILIVFNLIFFILMSPKINLHLGVFLGLSIACFLSFLLIMAFWVFSVWAIAGMIESLLYSLGSFVHILKGKRWVKDVMAPH